MLMKKRISLPAAVLLCVLCAVLASMITVLTLRESYNSALYELNRKYAGKLAAVEEQMEVYGEIAADLREIDALYRENYPDELDTEALREGVIRGYIVGAGDRYGFYYSPEEAAALTNDMEGETDGIGVSVIYDASVGCIEIISVYPDSPAEAAGVVSGDYIGYIIGEDGTREAVAELGYENALARLRGEAGTDARFVILRDDDGDGVYSELETVATRAHIDARSVEYHLYEPDSSIGVVRITGFDGNTPEQFIAAVEALRADGAEKLIFDVRYNPGGRDDSVCAVLDYLLPEGPLLRTVDSEGNYTVKYYSDESCLDMPMAVVMNSGTASAGELFAAAIRDYGAGKLVGDVTYGKGSIQMLTPVLDDGSILKLTYALYCPPVSDNYDGVGITPDVSVTLDESLADKSFYKLTDDEDNQLRAAAAALTAASE